MSPWRALVDSAWSGDREAERLLCEEAARCIRAGEPFPPALGDWLQGGLIRRAGGRTWTRAFTLNGRQSPADVQSRKRWQDLTIAVWVDRHIANGAQTADPNNPGEPGPAFVLTAESLGLSPITVRNRYYRIKRQRG